MQRKIKKINKAIPVLEGAGVLVNRAISNNDVKDYDPFLLLDAFDSNNYNDFIKGFPWHPHRGIETVTYLINGEVEHGDSLGNAGTIYDGDCQWMTAGKGIIHQELPKKTDSILGVQLWINLPAKHKMCNPKYRDITNKDITEHIDENGNISKIISGSYKGKIGAICADYVKAKLIDFEIPAGNNLIIETEKDTTVFIYIIQGSAKVDDSPKIVESKNAVLFDNGSIIKINNNNQKLRFFYFEALPLNEPIAWGGPIVMNTQEELQKAFEDLDNGKFIPKE